MSWCFPFSISTCLKKVVVALRLRLVALGRERLHASTTTTTSQKRYFDCTCYDDDEHKHKKMALPVRSPVTQTLRATALGKAVPRIPRPHAAGSRLLAVAARRRECYSPASRLFCSETESGDAEASSHLATPTSSSSSSRETKKSVVFGTTSTFNAEDLAADLLDQRIMALVSAVPPKHSEQNQNVRDLVFHPRRNSNSFTRYRINQLLRTRKWLLSEAMSEEKSEGARRRDVEGKRSSSSEKENCSESTESEVELTTAGDAGTTSSAATAGEEVADGEGGKPKQEIAPAACSAAEVGAAASTTSSGSEGTDVVEENERTAVPMEVSDKSDPESREAMSGTTTEPEGADVSPLRKKQFSRAAAQKRLKDVDAELVMLGHEEFLHCSSTASRTVSVDEYLRARFAKFSISSPAATATTNGEKNSLWKSVREYSKLPVLVTNRFGRERDAFVALDRSRERFAGFRSRGAPPGDQHGEDGCDVLEQRMQTLWRVSNSHGVSWDALDEEYLKWSHEGQTRARKWNRCVWPTEIRYEEAMKKRKEVEEKDGKGGNADEMLKMDYGGEEMDGDTDHVAGTSGNDDLEIQIAQDVVGENKESFNIDFSAGKSQSGSPDLPTSRPPPRGAKPTSSKKTGRIPSTNADRQGVNRTAALRARARSMEENLLQKVREAAYFRASKIIQARVRIRKQKAVDNGEEFELTDVQQAAMVSGLRRAMLHKWKQLYLRWHRPGQLVRHLREMVLLRQADREMAESAGGTVGSMRGL